jgi:hypothetical protein
MRRNSATEAADTKIRETTLSELTAGGNPEVEVISDMSAAELEAFMNEPVDIFMHPARENGDLDVQVINVNGVNQPIIKGRQTRIKRKYVEAIARGHSIRYTQTVPDPGQPDHIKMIERKIPSYPFDVIADTSKGKAWLKTIYESL